MNKKRFFLENNGEQMDCAKSLFVQSLFINKGKDNTDKWTRCFAADNKVCFTLKNLLDY